MTIKDLINVLDTCNAVHEIYKDIINAYVADFYVEDHWLKLPKSWRNVLSSLDTNEIADLLNICKPINTKSYPLSILCLRQIILSYSIPRNNNTSEKLNIEDKAFLKAFWKNVKLKKRHEINLMSKMCHKSSLKTNCNFIVDVGSGLGHLSRMLAFGYDLKVCAFEAEPTLSKMAPILDTKFKTQIKSIKNPCIVHVNQRIEYDMSVKEFLILVKKAFGIEDLSNFKFGIVGLHPCGNLATTLLRLYKNCPNIIFINMASCCYMKMSFSSESNKGFPLSSYCNVKKYNLEYNSCEMACHAIENYIEKIKSDSEYETLKIHAYRAALEKILISVSPRYRHISTANVKCINNLSFKEYCNLALRKTGIVVNCDNIFNGEELIKSWKQVICFYSIRLMLAPLIETIILYDRLLFIKESNDSECYVLPIFDCKISPRNHVLCATKINGTVNVS